MEGVGQEVQEPAGEVVQEGKRILKVEVEGGLG